jgi:hypothetical protein
VTMQIEDGNLGGRGIVVQDVHAPVKVVIDRILDFSAYPRMVSRACVEGVVGSGSGS